MGRSNLPSDEEIVEFRARELLDSSSTSVRSELAHAEGWLRGANTNSQAPGWQVDVVAGALGALANAWGRLTLWSQGNGTYEQVREDLDGSMKTLVELSRRLVSEGKTEGDTEKLRDILERMHRMYETVEQGESR